MNNEQTLKMTELDYLTAAPHLQMIKAALPYIHIPEQRFFSLMVKVSELERTIKLFDKKEDGEVGICSLESDEPATPIDMLNAMKPFGTEEEQDFIDLILNFMQASRLYQSYQDEMNLSGQEAEDGRPDAPEFGGPQMDGRQMNGQQMNGAQTDGRTTGSDEATYKEDPEENSGHRGDFRRFPIEQLKGMLPPEQQSRLETAQMLMQTFGQFSN